MYQSIIFCILILHPLVALFSQKKLLFSFFRHDPYNRSIILFSKRFLPPIYNFFLNLFTCLNFKKVIHSSWFSHLFLLSFSLTVTFSTFDKSKQRELELKLGYVEVNWSNFNITSTIKVSNFRANSNVCLNQISWSSFLYPHSSFSCSRKRLGSVESRLKFHRVRKIYRRSLSLHYTVWIIFKDN